MSDVERYVYLLLVTRDRRPHQWTESNRAPEPIVFDDAWSAIAAGRAELGAIEKIPVEPAEHEAGVVWSGRTDSTEVLVRRHKVWPTKPLGGDQQ